MDPELTIFLSMLVNMGIFLSVKLKVMFFLGCYWFMKEHYIFHYLQ
jgi:hypothetical protein